MSAIGDRGADLSRFGVGRVVIPLIAFAPFNAAAQIVEVIDAGRTGLRIQMILACAPVGQGHVVVDPDEIDLRICPERIEVEIAVSLRALVAPVFGPVRSIADLGLCPQYLAHLLGEIAQRSNRGKALIIADLGQRAHL